MDNMDNVVGLGLIIAGLLAVALLLVEALWGGDVWKGI